MFGPPTEFIFVFNDSDRADAAAREAQEVGYDTAVLPGDGEGRHYQLRLRLPRALPATEFDERAESLRRIMAKHRGRYEGGHSGE
jgi:hypothetical protein